MKQKEEQDSNPFKVGDVVYMRGDPDKHYEVVLVKRETIVIEPLPEKDVIISDNYWHYREI